MPKKKSSKIIRGHSPRKSKDLPATLGMLDAVRDELKSDISSISLEIRALAKQMDSGFKKLDAKWDLRFQQMDTKWEARLEQSDTKWEARFQQMALKLDVHRQENDLRFQQYETKAEERHRATEIRFDRMDSKFEKFQAELHRQTALMEEQAAQSKFVLDGYQSLYERQDRVEVKLEATDNRIMDLIKRRASESET